MATKVGFNLRSQFGTSSYGGQRYLPMAFTELGIAVLSSILKSPVAIQVNIQIIRLFSEMRETLLTHKDLMLEMEQIRSHASGQDEKIEMIFDYLRQLEQSNNNEISKVGYKKAK